MKKKKIAVDARFILRPMRGMPLYVLMLCRHLPTLSQNYHFYYFINKGFEHNDTPENYLPRIKEIEKSNPNVSFVNYDDEGEIMWEQIYLHRLIKQYQIDLLHMPGNRICFFTGVPTIVTVHDIIEYKQVIRDKLICSLNRERNLRLWFYHMRIAFYIWLNYKIGFKKAKKIITVSEYSATDIIKHLRISSEKVVYIHHGLDDEYKFKEKETIDTNEENRNHVLMLGGDSPHKNPEGAIFSWSKVPENLRKKYPLKIIGFTGDEQSPLLMAIRKYNLQNQIEVIGWVKKTVMINYLRTAKLFIYLSIYEGFGFPPLHAMASGTPVVTSHCTSIPEILGNVGLKYHPQDYNGIAKGITTLLTDELLWLNQSELGKKRSKDFQWEKSILKHMEQYKKVLRDLNQCYQKNE